ncbi:SCO family protein [Flavobacteriaceae bacterium]|nr:SCO family protein [Flavobacteriaceae bacterium]
MLKFFAKYKTLALVMAVLSVIIISAIYFALAPEPKLRIYQPNDVAAELVDTTLQHVKKYHQIADFSLVNQLGDTITQKTFEGRIYVADFFFTTCATICPIMTEHMGQIQRKINNDPDILLLSHTVTPEIDTVAQLKRYADKKGVIAGKWHLVTGDKKEIYDLARKSYLVAKDQPYSPYDLVHTENFVLIDPQRRIRGFYDGTDPAAIESLLEDIAILKKEGQ